MKFNLSRISKYGKTFLFFLIFLIFCSGFSFISAETRPLEINYPTIGGITPTTATSLPDLVIYIFNFAIGISGLLAFVMITMGGFSYVTSAGNTGKTKKAREQIFSAFLGLIILLSSYIILININPQLVIFTVPEIIKPPTVALPAEGPKQITSSIEVELPPGTIIEERIFDQKRLTKIKSLADKTIEVAIGPSEPNASSTSNDIKELTEKCTCSSPNVTPCPCKGNCYMWDEQVCSMEDADGNCISWKTQYNCDPTENDPNSCQNCHCESDPCKEVRIEITNKKNENNEKNIGGNNRLLSLQDQTNKEILDLNMELDRLKKSMELMMVCPIKALADLPEFNSIRRTYENQNWKLKKVSYWEDIISVKLSASTFYCPAGGTIEESDKEAIIDSSTSIMYQNLANEQLQGSPEEDESQLVCNQPIPLGEIFDNAAAITTDLINKMTRLVEENKKLVAAIDSFHQQVNGCTSNRCITVCSCGLSFDSFNNPISCECKNDAGQMDGNGNLKSGTCTGDPCGNISTNIINDIAEEIKKIRNEIYNIIDKQIPIITNPINKTGSLDAAKRALTVGFMEDPSGQNGLLRDCSQIIGNVGTEGKAIKDPLNCRYGDWQKDPTIIKFPSLMNYNCTVFTTTGKSTEELLSKSSCVAYNFAFCRVK